MHPQKIEKKEMYTYLTDFMGRLIKDQGYDNYIRLFNRKDNNKLRR